MSKKPTFVESNVDKALEITFIEALENIDDSLQTLISLHNEDLDFRIEQAHQKGFREKWLEEHPVAQEQRRVEND